MDTLVYGYNLRIKTKQNEKASIKNNIQIHEGCIQDALLLNKTILATASLDTNIGFVFDVEL